MSVVHHSREDERAERAALLARCLDDFRLFCRGLVQIAPKSGERATLKWNPIQTRYCERRTWRDIILKSRQVGMTTLELARDVWQFVRAPGQRVLVVCQSVADAAPPWKKVSADLKRMLAGLKAAGLELDYGTESESMWTLPARDSTLQIIEAGASEAAATKKARGGTFTRIHLTEVAFFEHASLTTNAMFEGVPRRPGTEIVMESTPNGSGTWFHNQWLAAVSKESEYTAHFFPWFLDPDGATPLLPGELIEPRNEREEELVVVYRVTSEQLKFYRSKVVGKGGQSVTDQEYPSDPVRAFLSSGRTYFDIGQVDALGVHSAPPVEVRGHWRFWKKPTSLGRYVLALDPAEGLGEESDDSYGGIFDRDTQEHVASYRSKLQPNPVAEEIVPVAREFNHAQIIVERNKGMAVIGACQSLGYGRLYSDEDDKPGFATTATNKPVLLEHLADAVRTGGFVTHDEVLVAQMKAFVINPRDGKPYAPTKGRKNGTSDDAIIMSALALRAMLRPETSAVRTGGERGAARPSKYAF